MRAKLCPPLGDGQSAEEEGLNGRGKLMKRSIGHGNACDRFGRLRNAGGGSDGERPPPHYTVINLGTLGGSQSNGYGGVTNNGWVSGDSSCRATRPSMPLFGANGVMTDLGTLGGLNSSTAWPQKNNHGLIVGQAQGSQPDPLGEYWGVAYVCDTSGGHCTGYQNLQFGFLWQNGVMTALPTLWSAITAPRLGTTTWAKWSDLRRPAKDPMCPTSPTNQPNQPQQLVINAVV